MKTEITSKMYRFILSGLMILVASLGSMAQNIPASGIDCDDWVLYYADITGGDFTSIYAVSFDDAGANLDLIATSEIEVHIAYNSDDNLIYAVSNADGSYRTLDPHAESPEFSETVTVEAEIDRITMAAFNNDGKLIIGDAGADLFYLVDVSTNMISTYDTYAPIEGGDIAFGQDGTPFMASKEGNGGLYVFMDGDDMLIGDLPGNVTGMALASSNQLLVSRQGGTSFLVRELNGDDNGETIAVLLDGEPFTTSAGDMASGCNTSNNNEGDCAYKLYYTHSGPGAQDGLYELTLGEDGIATANFITSQGQKHIALSPDGSLIYMVGGSNLDVYEVSTGDITSVNIFNGANQANLSSFPAAVTNAAGELFIAGAGSNVWQVNTATGEATNIASGISVNGGDLIFAPTGEEGQEELWIITRNNNKFRKVLEPSVTFTVAVPEINGAAVLANGNVLLANGDGDGLEGYIEVSLADGSIVDSYDVDLPVFNGDLAGGCTNNNPVDVCEGENGACYATFADYTPGSTLGGGAISPSRAISTNAEGMPERTDDMVFTTLGYGGFIIFEFGGLVPNGEGDDIEVVETSFNNPGCDAYPEYATVSVSVDGLTYYVVDTVCKGDPFVDIADAVDANGAPVALGCVNYVKVANNDALTSTPDGFDVDGIKAIHNCENAEEADQVVQAITLSQDVAEFTSYPNPTAGPSQAVFTTMQTTRTSLEVYDMNGRSIATLFSGVANAGQQYMFDFDGAGLPNGVYIYRLTTETESVIEKFMIAK